MLDDLQPYIKLLVSVITAFGITYVTIPSLINISIIKNLFDEENSRKSHSGVIPNLGGFAIFGAFIISYAIMASFTEREIKYIVAALCLMFFVGAKDDIIELTPYKKFIGEIIAAFIIVVLGGVKLTSLYGVFGITDLPEIISIIFTMTTIVFIINAYNIIDGVDGLAAGVSLVIFSTFGAWFYIHGFVDYAIMSACVVGAVLAFSKYNFSPARIFLGDAGSLSLGLIASTMSIILIQNSEKIIYLSDSQPFHIKSGPAMTVAILIVPIFDTLRVFTIRILKGQSPFSADRRHHHHKLLDLGFSHMQTTSILVSVNILFIVATFYLQNLRNAILIPLIFGVAFLLSSLLFLIKNKSEPNASTITSKLEVENEKNEVVNLQ